MYVCMYLNIGVQTQGLAQYYTTKLHLRLNLVNFLKGHIQTWSCDDDPKEARSRGTFLSIRGYIWQTLNWYYSEWVELHRFN